VQVLVSTDVSILHDVLGFGIVSHDGASHAIKALVVSSHDDFVKSGFPRQNAVHYFFVSPAFRRSARDDFADWHALITIERARRERLQRVVRIILRVPASGM